VRDKESREQELDAALKSAQQLVEERNARTGDLEEALQTAQLYVRERENDILLLNAQIDGLKQTLERIEKHWLLAYLSKILIRSND